MLEKLILNLIKFYKDFKNSIEYSISFHYVFLRFYTLGFSIRLQKKIKMNPPPAISDFTDIFDFFVCEF